MKALRLLAASAVALCLLAPDRASAEGKPSVSVTLFREGRDALRTGDFVTACSKFRESDAVEPSSGAKLNLGDCAVRKGDFAEAEKLYHGAAFLSEGDKKTFALQRAAAAHAALATILLRWAAGASPRARVEVDGAVVTMPAELLVNPGRRVVTVQADGYDDHPQDLDLASGGRAELTFAPLAPRATVTSLVAPQATSATDGASTPSRPSASRSPLPYILMGVGGLGVVAGVVTGLIAKSARDDVAEVCGVTPCPGAIWARADVKSNYGRAEDWATVSTVAFIAGAASLVAGGTWWLTTTPSAGGEPRYCWAGDSD